MPLPPKREAEISSLSARYGMPHRTVVDLQHSNFDPLIKKDRIGEVCMVVRRPDGRLITARKTFYPPEAYRLLTGGIKQDEGIEDALLRETWEETSLDVVVRQFLAVIEYHASAEGYTDQPIPLEFYTFAFLLDEVGGELAPQDEHERIESFRFVRPDELPAIADALEHVRADHDDEIGGRWRDWGIFRAVAHRLVAQALA